MATERVQIVVRLPADVVARLRQERAETGRSLQAILEEAVKLRAEWQRFDRMIKAAKPNA